MCFVCSCFGWALDFIQRAITFVFACCIAFCVCCALSVAIIAGIAYGYNYCMAEFMTLTRSDVTVYMRRGQFYDPPDVNLVKPHLRRMGDDDYDLLSNKSTDYRDFKQKIEPNPLYDSMEKAQDTRRYAEKLTKYSPQKKSEEAHRITKKVLFYKLTTMPTRIISIPPNPAISTALLRGGSSDIIMRKFQPVTVLSVGVNDPTENYEFYDIADVKGQVKKLSSTVSSPSSTVHPDVKIRIDDRPKGIVLTTAEPQPDYPTDVDEDNIVYKPV